MESDPKKLLKDSIPFLKSSNLPIDDLVSYLRTRKLITAKIHQATLKMKKDDMIDSVIEGLSRKESRGWAAIRDWLVRNAPVSLYRKIVGEDFPTRKNLLPEFDMTIENHCNEVECPSTPDVKDVLNNLETMIRLSTTDAEPISEGNDCEDKANFGGKTIDPNEDAVSDPWGDCTDENLMEMLTQVENQGSKSIQVTDEKSNENDIYMQELWTEIISDKLSLGDVTNNRMRCKLNLGRNIFVTAGLWKGQMKIHIRRFDPSRGFATEKGVVFDLNLWKKLEQMVDEIDQNYDKIQKMNGLDVIMEVGERIFVAMEIGSPLIDLRLWWHPRGSKCLARSTKGVKLNPWQWNKVKAVFRYLPVFVPELNG
jgi:hypothetical protein